MAADINDKFKKVSADDSYAVATTVKTARTVGGGTTLEAFDLSKWADQTAVNFLTYRKTTDPVTNITTVTNRTGWTALVNTGSNTLTNLTVAPGYTDLGHQVGDYIEPVQMSKWANDLVDGILVTHNQDGTLKNKVATLSKIHGGSTDGVLLTDASGNVTGGKVTAGKLDFATFISPDSADWKVTTLPSGKKQYRRVVVGSDVSISGGATGAAQTVAPPTGISGTDILSGSYLITSTYTSNAAGWDRMIGKTSISSSTISLSVYNSTAGSLNTGNQARWFLEITEM